MAHRRTSGRPNPFASRSLMSYITLPAISSLLLAVGKPRKPKMHRTTSLALFALIAVSTYIFFVARPTLAHTPITLRAESSSNGGMPGRRIPIIIRGARSEDLPRSRLYYFPPSYRRKSQAAVPVERPQVQLDKLQELAAVASFLASLPQNVIPSSVDPNQPIDPQLVLDFDARSPRAAGEVRKIVEDVWTLNPVVLFSELHTPLSREVKTIIADMNLSPPPTIFDVDQREDANVLTPLLFRLTTSTDLPILLIGGKYVGTLPQIREFHRSGDLHRMVTDAGAVIDGAPRKKKGRK